MEEKILMAVDKIKSKLEIIKKQGINEPLSYLIDVIVEQHDENERQKEQIKQLESFYNYITELYGQGLTVLGWNKNGELEAFEELVDEAERKMNSIYYEEITK